MNPYTFSNINTNTNFQMNQRDKTKSYFQPNSPNQFIANSTNSHFISGNSGSQPSQKFKNYYNQYQDYRNSSVSQIETNYMPDSQRQSHNKSSNFLQQKFSNTSPNSFFPSTYERHTEKSQERNRLYTLTGNQRDNNHFKVQKPSETSHPFSNSMIFLNEQSHSLRTSKTKDQINPKKDLFKFVNQKFSNSRVQSAFNSRQKKSQVNQNKSQFLQKANKKISLKRDTATNHQKSRQVQNKTISQAPNIQQTYLNRQKAASFFEQGFKSQKNQRNYNLESISNLQRFSSSNSDVSEYKGKQLSFKKNSIMTYDIVNDLGSSQLSSNNTMTSPSTSRGTGQTFLGSIKQNKLNNANPNDKASLSKTKDIQLQTDLKISRMDESTSNLEQKIYKVTKNIHTLSHHYKEHQTSLNQINQYISKQEEQGITRHDVKRIKKQLKIMKTNFQTAFTSMTEQINRKLIKQENIMKSLSEEIRIVAHQNQNFSMILQEKSKKVENLEKSMTSFMRQNEERMQNIVLNESLSSSKRSKNHSFEYGLELKNMSGEENYSSAGKQSQHLQNLIKKMQNVQREIKKMKIFHIEQQQSYRIKFTQLRLQIQQVENRKQKGINIKQIQQIARQVHQEIMAIKFQTFSQKITERQQKKLSSVRNQIQIFRRKLQELHKICHEELFEFRMNKMEALNNNNILISHNKTDGLSSKFEQNLSQLQQKQRSLLSTLTEYQQKLIFFEDGQHNICKNIEENRLKQLKMTGDVRQMQLATKQLKQQMAKFRIFRQKNDVEMKEQTNKISIHGNLFSNIESKLKQLDRINGIQTQNIESINSEFERVINGQIIPKFGQVHQMHMEVNQRLSNLTGQISGIKNSQPSVGPDQVNRSIENRQIDKKVEKYFEEHVQKFLKRNVKVVSTRSVNSEEALCKIGLFRKISQSDYSMNQEQVARKQQTYLIDEKGYLMDWQGAYLTEKSQSGLFSRIKVTEQHIYFMELNGIQVKRSSLR